MSTSAMVQKTRNPKAPLPSEVRMARRAIRAAVKDIRALDLPPFGVDLGVLRGDELADAVVAHRILKHYPEVTLAPQARKKATIEAMLAYDSVGYRHAEYCTVGSHGIPVFDYRLVPQPYRGLLLKARAWLAKHFGKIPRSHVFRYPTGETFVSSNDATSLLEKLTNSDQWVVSYEASKDAAAVCYHNQQLKRLVKDRFKQLHQDTGIRAIVLKRWWCEATGNKPFSVFHKMFVACCSISNVSRLSTVPKDGAKDRTISMEPMWNMVAQLSFAADLRACLLSRVGVDLESRSHLHGTLVRHHSKATIDFSNASNSNWMVVLKWLLPPYFLKKIEELRTPICQYQEEYHQYNMMAPMGCGMTFEVMTIVLLALSRACDESATVFGDDVILDASNADVFMRLSDIAGWVVNKDKSFVDGSFRESCGVYYDVSVDRRIVCYDMRQPDTLGDVILLANKAYRILTSYQITHALRTILLKLYRNLLVSLPRVVLGDWRIFGHEWLPSGVALAPPQMVSFHQKYSLVSRCIAWAYQRPVTVQTVCVHERKRTEEVCEGTTRSPAYSAFLRAGMKPKPNGEPYSRFERIDAHSGTPLSGIPLLTVL